jgi:hypothetical protein
MMSPTYLMYHTVRTKLSWAVRLTCNLSTNIVEKAGYFDVCTVHVPVRTAPIMTSICTSFFVGPQSDLERRTTAKGVANSSSSYSWQSEVEDRGLHKMKLKEMVRRHPNRIVGCGGEDPGLKTTPELVPQTLDQVSFEKLSCETIRLTSSKH